jgi:hypothetical protein
MQTSRYVYILAMQISTYAIQMSCKCVAGDCMENITFRAHESLVRAINRSLDPITGESRSDFLRAASINELHARGFAVGRYD